MAKTKQKKTWAESFATTSAKGHEIKPVNKDMMGMKAGQIMLIATPEIVADGLRVLPKGTVTDPKEFRSMLADKMGAEVTCPITTGIFLRIVAEAANDEVEAGTPLSSVTPFWRVLDEKASTTKRLSFDMTPYYEQAALEAQ